MREWNDFKHGDIVTVIDPRFTKYRGVSFVFRCHVTNVTTDHTWIEVYGGRPGRHKEVAIAPEKVIKIQKKVRTTR